MNWVPEDCTLPTAEQPLRVAEFDALFTEALRGVERIDNTHLRLRLDGADHVERTARELTARETSCCSFFTFTFDRTAEDLTLDVQVPPAHAAVLDGLVARTAS
ncbi:hypothetical protein ACTMTI_24960 [Nonomuraea sp. H19]|uniref:hypothetical protein n=1 Tax=Nonomuraea sp. H19 TaxID=3452206 RepID=UPI003F89A325